MDLDHLFVFIMAGGSGERFWPLSRAKTPKHLLKLFSDQSLLEQTVRRLEGIVPPERIFVLINEMQRENTLKDLSFLPPGQIICEPAKRDTAPAASLAAAIARSRDPLAVTAVLPADHLIKDVSTFQRNLRDAVTFAASSPALITLGIQPAWASPGFGYLELDEPLQDGPEGSKFHKLKRFVEKPDAQTAQAYLDSGNYRWNAGMFIWKAESFYQETLKHQPALARFIETFPAQDFSTYLTEKFPSLPKISVDYAIMEQAESVVTVQADFDWDDVGAWTALPSHLPKDTEGNSYRGATANLDSKGNILFSTKRLIATCGVSDLVIVESEDAVLVCHQDRVQDIKKLLPSIPPDLL